MKYYEEIISNKTAFYTIFLPVYLGLVITSSSPTILHATSLYDACMLLGRFFQVRDDYLDVFASTSVLGKEGTDIQEGKCSWVILTVLNQCTKVDREELEIHYGKKDPEDVRYVREIFGRYNVEKGFLEYQENTLKQISAILNSPAFPEPKLLPLFHLLIKKLFKKV